MKLEEFIANQVEALMEFQSGWLESHKTKEDRYPLEYPKQEMWEAQLNFYYTRLTLGALLEEAEKHAKTSANSNADAA